MNQELKTFLLCFVIFFIFYLSGIPAAYIKLRAEARTKDNKWSKQDRAYAIIFSLASWFIFLMKAAESFAESKSDTETATW